MKYNDNSDIVRQLKSVMALQGITQKQLAERLGVLQPSLNRTMNKTDLSFAKIKEIANIINCDLYIEIKPREQTD